MVAVTSISTERIRRRYFSHFQRAEALFANVVTRSSGDSRVVILMHDMPLKDAPAEIIEHYRSKGYSFGSLAKQHYQSLRLPS